MEDTFSGSLPAFIAAFMQSSQITADEAEETQPQTRLATYVTICKGAALSASLYAKVSVSIGFIVFYDTA